MKESALLVLGEYSVHKVAEMKPKVVGCKINLDFLLQAYAGCLPDGDNLVWNNRFKQLEKLSLS